MTTAAFSPRTMQSRQSILKQVRLALEASGVCGKFGRAQAKLIEFFTVTGIEEVTKMLQRKKLFTGPVYLRTWRNYVERMALIDEPVKKHLDLAVRTVTIARGKPQAQAQAGARDQDREDQKFGGVQP